MIRDLMISGSCRIGNRQVNDLVNTTTVMVWMCVEPDQTVVPYDRRIGRDWPNRGGRDVCEYIM
jgi:hypothetical protein